MGAKLRHFALIGIHGGVVLLLGGDGDGDLTSEADAKAAMSRRKLEHVTGDMFVYLKHGGGGGADEQDGGRKIVLETPAREYRLRAKTSEEARVWVTALKDSIAAAAAESDGGHGHGGEATPSRIGTLGSVTQAGMGSPGVVRSGTHRGSAGARPSSERSPNHVGVSRADLEMGSPSSVPSWELDSPASLPSPQQPSPGSSWALATYQTNRPTYINGHFSR